MAVGQTYFGDVRCHSIKKLPRQVWNKSDDSRQAAGQPAGHQSVEYNEVNVLVERTIRHQ